MPRCCTKLLNNIRAKQASRGDMMTKYKTKINSSLLDFFSSKYIRDLLIIKNFQKDNYFIGADKPSGCCIWY
jgi:hypothetical protein